MPAEADRQRDQLRGVLHELGATPATLITVLSDGADGPRSLGESASVGPTHHVLDCWDFLPADKEILGGSSNPIPCSGATLKRPRNGFSKTDPETRRR
jgi:hypothetical protein